MRASADTPLPALSGVTHLAKSPMPYANSLLVRVVLGLALAACGGFLARKMRMPPLVGYLVAGVAIGPFTPGIVGDANFASQLAEMVSSFLGSTLVCISRSRIYWRCVVLRCHRARKCHRGYGAGVALSWDGILPRA
jgi:hypothetical protein